MGREGSRKKRHVNPILWRKRPAQLVGDPRPPPALPAAPMGWSQQGPRLRLERMVPVATGTPPCTQWPATRLRWLTISIRLGLGLQTWPWTLCQGWGALCAVAKGYPGRYSPRVPALLDQVAMMGSAEPSPHGLAVVRTLDQEVSGPTSSLQWSERPRKSRQDKAGLLRAPHRAAAQAPRLGAQANSFQGTSGNRVWTHSPGAPFERLTCW